MVGGKTSLLLSHLRSWHSYWVVVFFCNFQMGAKAAKLLDLTTAEIEIFSGVVYRVSVLWVDSQGPVTHAHGHKQGFSPLEKITLIITGCIWTCPQREREGGDESWLRRREKGESHIRWCIPACCVILVLSFPSVCTEISTRWRVQRATDAALGAVDADI